MTSNLVALKGNIVFTKQLNQLCVHENSWVVCKDKKVVGLFENLPAEYENAQIFDYENCIIVPGMTDLHTHAPQYAFRGTGMDLQLLEWLNTYTFKEEAKYKNLEYAKKAYELFVQDIKQSTTTRAVIFATVHSDATLLLMEMMEQSGLISMVGKVNMDRNSPDYLVEDTSKSISDTYEYIEKAKKFKNTMPILTPRFTPSCTDGCMAKLGEIQKEFSLSVQSHLSENKAEIEWVKSLCPDCESYADTYKKAGLLHPNCNTVLAHCVHPSQRDTQLLQEKGSFVAHCPQSNINLTSGVAPVRMFLDKKIKTGLGTDCAGGACISMLKCMQDAIGASKMRCALLDDTQKPLSMAEAFYLATKGGGEFFGKVGSFEEDYEFDAVVLCDNHLPHPQPMSVADRLERMIYIADERAVKAKFVMGNKIF